MKNCRGVGVFQTKPPKSEKHFLQGQQQHPRRVAFNAAVSACEKAGQWRVALGLLQRMPKEMPPDGVSGLSMSVSGCRSQGLFGAFSQGVLGLNDLFFTNEAWCCFICLWFVLWREWCVVFWSWYTFMDGNGELTGQPGNRKDEQPSHEPPSKKPRR